MIFSSKECSFKNLMVERLLFFIGNGAGDGAAKKNTRGRSKMDRILPITMNVIIVASRLCCECLMMVLQRQIHPDPN